MSLPEDFLKQLEQYGELSNREKEVFIEIFGRGKSRVEVAQTLNICDSNLSSCLTGIYKKFQITGSGPVKEPRLREYLEKRYSQQKFPVNANDDIADDRIDALAFLASLFGSKILGWTKVNANDDIADDRIDALGIYSFSHLTFHEYFTAKKIVANSASKTLVEHITEKRWREVFFLTIGMMRKADDLLVLMKHKIDGWVAEDKKLQSFLIWIIEKSSSCLNQYPKKAALRAFCIAMNLDQERANAMDLDRAFSFDKDSFLIESGRIVNNFFDRGYVDSFRDKISSYINKIIFISPDFTLGNTIVNNHEVSRMIVSQIIHFSEFEKLLNELKNEIYEKEKISPEEQHSKKTTWLLKINTWMKNNLDIFCYWDFDYTQKELLKNIFMLMFFC